jgi:hypothetical protein
MKKFFLTVLFSLLLGGIFGFYIYKKMNKNNSPILPTISTMEVYAIQGGIFNDYDNALTLATRYSGIVVPSDDKYRVYLGIATSNNGLSLMKNYYDHLGLSYYVKQIDVTAAFLDKLNTDEELLTATTEDNYQPIINDILKEYEKTLT